MPAIRGTIQKTLQLRGGIPGVNRFLAALMAIALVAGCVAPAHESARLLVEDALHHALQWHPEAQLVGISGIEPANAQEVRDDLSDMAPGQEVLQNALAPADDLAFDGKAASWFFLFQAPHGFLLLVLDPSGAVRFQDELGFASPMGPRLTDFVDSDAALAAAQRNETFARALQDARVVFLDLALHPQPVWSVSVRGETDVVARVDGEGGEFLGLVERAPVARDLESGRLTGQATLSTPAKQSFEVKDGHDRMVLDVGLTGLLVPFSMTHVTLTDPHGHATQMRLHASHGLTDVTGRIETSPADAGTWQLELRVENTPSQDFEAVWHAQR